MSFSISINFRGNCREAVTFYAKLFNQELPDFLTYDDGDTSFDSNFKVSEKMKKQIMFVCLDIVGTTVEFNDMPDTFEFIRGNSMFLNITYNNIKEAKTIFKKLSENGNPAVHFAEIPGQGYYGMVIDQFDLGWIIRAKDY